MSELWTMLQRGASVGAWVVGLALVLVIALPVFGVPVFGVPVFGVLFAVIARLFRGGREDDA